MQNYVFALSLRKRASWFLGPRLGKGCRSKGEQRRGTVANTWLDTVHTIRYELESTRLWNLRSLTS